MALGWYCVMIKQHSIEGLTEVLHEIMYIVGEIEMMKTTPNWVNWQHDITAKNSQLYSAENIQYFGFIPLNPRIQ